MEYTPFDDQLEAALLSILAVRSVEEDLSNEYRLIVIIVLTQRNTNAKMPS